MADAEFRAPIPEGEVPRIGEATQEMAANVGKGLGLLAGWYYSGSAVTAGAAYGASAGAVFGPIGIAAGGAVGGAAGFVAAAGGGFWLGRRAGFGISEVVAFKSPSKHEAIAIARFHFNMIIQVRDGVTPLVSDASYIVNTAHALRQAIDQALGLPLQGRETNANKIVLGWEQAVAEKDHQDNDFSAQDATALAFLRDSMAKLAVGDALTSAHQRALDKILAAKLLLGTLERRNQAIKDAPGGLAPGNVAPLLTFLDAQNQFSQLSLDPSSYSQKTFVKLSDDAFCATVEYLRALDAQPADIKNLLTPVLKAHTLVESIKSHQSLVAQDSLLLHTIITALNGAVQCLLVPKAPGQEATVDVGLDDLHVVKGEGGAPAPPRVRAGMHGDIAAAQREEGADVSAAERLPGESDVRAVAMH